jgi:chromate reductase
MTTILFLVGSARPDSLNIRLSRVIESHLPEGVTASHFDIFSLPFYVQEGPDSPTPAPVEELRAKLRDADGVFITTPEYNYSLPGVVKNAIDWASRPMVPRHAFVGKPMNAAVATGSATNGIRSLVDLKRLWAACSGAPVTTFDFVLQQASDKFVTDDDGRETLVEPARATMHFAIANLLRSIELDAGRSVAANWDAYVANLG